MPNSRICISIMAFLSGFMMIWLLNSGMALEPTSVTYVGSFRSVYFICMFALFAYFWIYFYRRPRGGRTLLDGRTALSGSALIVGAATGYAFIEFGLISSRSGGSFGIFVGYVPKTCCAAERSRVLKLIAISAPNL
jgi:hypothetical protein